MYLGHCKMVKMSWSFCQQVMGLLWQILKYFSLLPDVYDMLLGVTNYIVIVISLALNALSH
jgi:hypothetical protein